MEWLNIHTSTLDSETFLDAEPVDRATWLLLLRYCIGQENSGRILGAKAWSDRKWQQVASVTLKEVQRQCRLWNFDGDDMLVEFYPLKKQQEVVAMRSGGKDGAKARWAKVKDQATPPPNSPPIDSANDLPNGPAYAEWKGREGKGINPPTPQGGHGEGESGLNGSETYRGDVPSDAEILAWAPQWPGEPASGAPPMPVEWVCQWIPKIHRRQRPWTDWKRVIVAEWRAEFRQWGQTGSAAPARAVAPEIKRLDLTRQIEAVEGAIAHSPANSLCASWRTDCSDGDRENLKKMRARLKELNAALLEGSI